MSRDSEFSQEIADRLCDLIIEGESLRAICDRADMPSKSGVLKWLSSGHFPQFVDQYARAREMAADSDADDIGHYSRQAAVGEIEPGAATAAINGLKWTASRKAPKKYGDTTNHRHTGAIGTFDASKYTDAQLAELKSVLVPLAAAGGNAEGGDGGDSPARG